MTDTQHTANSRIAHDRPTPEHSPSTGWRETAALMHVAAGRGKYDAPTQSDPRDSVLGVTMNTTDTTDQGHRSTTDDDADTRRGHA